MAFLSQFGLSQFGLVGIVANAARGIPGVLARDDLRECFGFGAVRFMADDAEFGGIGENRLLAGEILRVTPERTVAGFASHIGVRTFALGGDDVIVAGGAGLAAGEDGSAGSDFIESGGAKMAVLPEVFGYQLVANDEESQYENHCNAR
jgi:hypothetical protein